METYQLKSKIVENGKEFLIQTINDLHDGVIKTNLFESGELIDASFMPHLKDVSEDEILRLVKSAHEEKKAEMEYLLTSFKQTLESGRPQAMYHLGTALFYKKMYQESFQLFEMASKLKEDYHEVFFFLCKTCQRLGKAKGAIQYGEKAVSMRGNFADYHNSLGEAFLMAKSCKRALIEFETAVEKNIYYAEAYYNIALTYILNAVVKEDYQMSSDLFGKCNDLFKKAGLIQPDYKNDPYHDGIDAFNSSDFKRAYALLKKVRDDRKNRQRAEKAALFNKIHLYTDWVSKESVSERVKFLESEIDKNPNYVDLYHELGVCYLYEARNSWKKGIEYFEKALSINKELHKSKRGLDLAREKYLHISDAVIDIASKDEN